MKRTKHFELTVPLSCERNSMGRISIEHTADVTITGVAENRGDCMTYDIDQVFVQVKYGKNVECKEQMEAIYGPLSDDPRFDNPIMAHIEKMDWNITRELDPTDLKQDAA